MSKYLKEEKEARAMARAIVEVMDSALYRKEHRVFRWRDNWRWEPTEGEAEGEWVIEAIAGDTLDHYLAITDGEEEREDISECVAITDIITVTFKHEGANVTYINFEVTDSAEGYCDTDFDKIFGLIEADQISRYYYNELIDIEE